MVVPVKTSPSKSAIPDQTIQSYLTALQNHVALGGCDKEAVRSSLSDVYSRLSLTPPEIVWCDSPMQFANLPWFLTIMLGTGDHAWRADLLKRFKDSAKKSKRQGMHAFWNCLDQWVSHESANKIGLGRVLSPEIVLQVHKLLISEASAQAECAFGLTDRDRIFDKTIQTMTNQWERLKLIFRGLGVPDVIPQMAFEAPVYAAPGTNWVKDGEPTVSLRPRAIVLGTSALSVWDMHSIIALDSMRSALPKEETIFSNDLEVLIDLWMSLFRNAFSYLFFENVCFVCCYPTKQTADEDGRWHNESGSAVAFPDGNEVYFWHGTPVSRVMHRRRKLITPLMIDLHPNLETRRIMMELYGFEKYLLKSRAKKIHQDECGTLYRKQPFNDEAMVAVEVINASPEPDGSFKRYFLRVPPNVTTARQAVAWTFGMKASEYEPKWQT